MKYLIWKWGVATLILLGTFCARSEANIAMELSVDYTCQIGEKPGVPTYSLRISEDQFEIEKTIGMLETTKLSAAGHLKPADKTTLLEILVHLQKSDLSSPKDHSKIEGSCLLEANTPNGKLKLSGGESNPQWKNANPFFKWVQGLHNKYPGLKAINPIFPDSPYNVSY